MLSGHTKRDTSPLGTPHPLGPAYSEPRSAPLPQAVDKPLDLVCLGACCSKVRESLQTSCVCLREPPPGQYSHLGHRPEAWALGFQPLSSHLQGQQGSNDSKQSSFPWELLYRALVSQRSSTYPGPPTVEYGTTNSTSYGPASPLFGSPSFCAV